MIVRICIVLLFTALVISNSKAQERKLEPIQNLSIASGLAHNGVTSICEDSRGYLWIGTYDGLNRYDGYEFKVFKNTPAKKLFVSNRIRSVVEDKSGDLWLGTDEGISIYKHSTEKFITIFSNNNSGKSYTGPVIRNIVVNSKSDKIVCSTEREGILFFNSDYTFAKQYIPPKTFNKRPILFYEGLVIDAKNYLFTSSAGLLHFNTESEKFDQIIENELNQHNSVIKLNEEVLLITMVNGLALARIKKKGNSCDFEITNLNKLEGQFRKAAIDKNGNIWLSVLNKGMLLIDANKLINKGVIEIKSAYRTDKGLFRTSCIHINDNTGAWVATFDKGIFRFNINDNPFRTFNSDVTYDFSVNYNRVTHISAFDKDRIIITAQGEGLTMYNTQINRFESLPPYISKINNADLSAVFVDSRNNIWLNFNNEKGFCRIRAQTTTVEMIDDKSSLSKDPGGLRQIVEDKSGNIWIVAIDAIFRINIDENNHILGIETLKDNPFFKNKENSQFRCIYCDYNFVWVGTSAEGLLRMNLTNIAHLKDAKIDQYLYDEFDRLSISSNFISCTTRLPNGELWVGTERGGICKVVNSTEEEPEFVNFSEDEGLSNNVVKAFISDNEQNLWISTNIGLNKFNTSKNQFRTFKKDNGLPFEDFYYSTAKLENGYFVFSGLNGFCYFNPKEVPVIEELPKLDFNNFKIFNSTIAPGDSMKNRVILEKSLSDTKEIILKHDENVFSLELTSLHFSTQENHFLRYQLTPINEEWILVPSNHRTINYNGLQPGEYELKVMASNSINEWTAPKTLRIIIKPPFWKTIPAYILYLLFIGITIYSIMHYILRIDRLQHNLEIEHLEKENVKEINAAKLRFFSNISHEIKTPLTLILGPVNFMAERYKANTELREKLQIVQRQSKKIFQLVNQVHDFQRADAGKLKMNYSTFCFNIFLKEIIGDFDFLAQTDKKVLELSGSDSKIYVLADKDKLEKIINNLLSNAFKYTKANDSITIEFGKEGNNLTISVRDTGRGIAAEDLPHIFERFYQSQLKYSEYTGGSGIGLAFTKHLVEMHYGYISAESTIEKGTSISLQLPVVSDQTVEDQENSEEFVLLAEREMEHEVFIADHIDANKITTGGDFSEATIFFAEDNTEMRNYIFGILSDHFKVQSFANGRECLKALENEWPDLIVSDVLMPELNGFDLCKRVKTDMKTSHIPVILLTACITIKDQIKGLEYGADSYINKPFHVQHLVTSIETLLQNRKQLRERFQIDYPLKLEQRKSSSNDVSFLEKLYHLMEKNIDNSELDMDKFAKELYLNRTHFYQKVKALTNQTPYELLKTYRLKRASELLVQKHLSVNEVFVMTGFKSRSNFSKKFKEKYDCTPGKYVSEANKAMK